MLFRNLCILLNDKGLDASQGYIHQIHEYNLGSNMLIMPNSNPFNDIQPLMMTLLLLFMVILLWAIPLTGFLVNLFFMAENKPLRRANLILTIAWLTDFITLIMFYHYGVLTITHI